MTYPDEDRAPMDIDRCRGWSDLPADVSRAFAGLLPWREAEPELEAGS